MTNVLVIKGNNRPEGVSTAMFETFMNEVEMNSSLNVELLDMFKESMPHFGQDLFDAYSNLEKKNGLSEKQKASYEAMLKCRKALDTADLVVFAFPLWNGTIPTAVQSFIDYTYASGYTFKYTKEGQFVSLMSHKKYIILNARGGNYSTPEMAPYEMAVNYVNRILGGDYGMQKINEVIIEGHDADRQNREKIISEGLEKVKEVAQQLFASTMK